VSIATADGEDYADRMSEQDVTRFRKQAEECRKQAERSVNVLDKDAWLRLAADWIRLAENGEKRRSVFPPPHE
jgi:hypothetical protein